MGIRGYARAFLEESCFAHGFEFFEILVKSNFSSSALTARV